MKKIPVFAVVMSVVMIVVVLKPVSALSEDQTEEVFIPVVFGVPSNNQQYPFPKLTPTPTPACWQRWHHYGLGYDR